MEVLNSVDPYVSVSLPQRWKIRGVLVMPALLYLFHSTFTSVWFVFLLFPFFLFLYDDTPFITFLNFTPVVHIFSLNYSKLNINFIKNDTEFLLFSFLWCIWVFWLHVCLYHICASFPWRPEEGDATPWKWRLFSVTACSKS